VNVIWRGRIGRLRMEIGWTEGHGEARGDDDEDKWRGKGK